MVSSFDRFHRRLGIVGAVTSGLRLVWRGGSLGAHQCLLSPCHLGSIPLIVGFINNGEKASRRRAFGLSLLFALGLLATLGVFGAAAAIADSSSARSGRFPRSQSRFHDTLRALAHGSSAFVAHGDIVEGRAHSPRRFWGSRLGLIYGLILGPCSFAFLAPMIEIAFSTGGAGLGFGIGLMAAFAFGNAQQLSLRELSEMPFARCCPGMDRERPLLVQASLRSARRCSRAIQVIG